MGKTTIQVSDRNRRFLLSVKERNGLRSCDDAMSHIRNNYSGSSKGMLF